MTNNEGKKEGCLGHFLMLPGYLIGGVLLAGVGFAIVLGFLAVAGTLLWFVFLAMVVSAVTFPFLWLLAKAKIISLETAGAVIGFLIVGLWVLLALWTL